MLTKEIIQAELEKIKFRDWKIELHERIPRGWHDTKGYEDKPPMYFIQVVFYEADNDDGSVLAEQRCRYWLIDTDKGPGEVVRTAYLAIEKAVLHEVQEQFLYNGNRVLDPHRDLTK